MKMLQILYMSLLLPFVEVQFNFSTPLVVICEGEDLPSRLSIVKNGQNEPNISFQVTITAATSGLNENGINCML